MGDRAALHEAMTVLVDGIDKDHHTYRTRAAKKGAIRTLYNEVMDTRGASLRVPMSTKKATKEAIGNLSQWYEWARPGIEERT